MRINNYSNNQNTFKGYDARQLTGIFVTSKNCQQELSRILKPIGLDVYIPNIASKSIRKEFATLDYNNQNLWAQDYLTFLQGKAVLFDYSREYLQRVLRAISAGIQKQLNLEPLKSVPHLRGGNYFICNVNGTRKLLVLENRLIFPDEVMKVVYDVDEICPIPRLDYHIDLVLRPLDNGDVLLADNKSTIDSMKKLKKSYKELLDKNIANDSLVKDYQNIINNIDLYIKKFEITEQFDKYKPVETTEQIAKSLKEYGFNPIRVPGRYYYLESVKTKEKEKEMLNNFEHNMSDIRELAQRFPTSVREKAETYIALQRQLVKYNQRIGVDLENFYNFNFTNAIVFKDKNNKIIYVTNAPLFDREIGITSEIEEHTGLSLRNKFIKSVSPYIDRENMYFISDKLTTKLFKYFGGVHCTAAEIP